VNDVHIHFKHITANLHHKQLQLNDNSGHILLKINSIKSKANVVSRKQ